jgi:hypothetical protein
MADKRGTAMNRKPAGLLVAAALGTALLTQHEYHHNGGLPGYLSENILLPQSQSVVIVLSNLDTSTPDDIAKHLAKLAGLTVIT